MEENLYLEQMQHLFKELMTKFLKIFEFNRKVKKERMEEYTNRDFALVRGENSEIIIIENTK